MTPTDEANAADTWLSALRSDYQPTPSVARERIAQRLAGAGVAALVVGGAAAVAQAAPRGFLYSKAFVVLLTLPLGITLGAAGHAWLARPVVVPLPAVSATQAPPVALAVAPATPPAVVAEAPPPRAQVNQPPSPPKARPSSSVTAPAAPAAQDTPGLAHELRLLEQARTQLSEGQATATLELLRQHRAQYPQSALEQEREALTVRALMATGRRAEAQQRAAAFVERYPSSVLRGSVERAVGKIP